MSEPCTGAKRDLGILLYPPTIPPPCDCYVDVLFPVGSIFGIFRNAGRKFFAKQLLSYQLTLLRTPLANAVVIRTYASGILSSLKSKTYGIITELQDIADKIRTATQQAKYLFQDIKQTMINIQTNTKLASQYRILIDQYSGGLVQWSPNGSPIVPNVITPQIATLLSNYNSTRAQLIPLKQHLASLELGLQFSEDGYKFLLAKQKALNTSLQSMHGPSISIGNHTIGENTILNQITELENLTSVLKADEDSINSIIKKGRETIAGGNQNNMVAVADEIGGRWSEIGARAADLLLDLLASLSIVEKVNCMEESMLNEETCECTECPSNKVLCSKPSGWLSSYLPQLPGIRSGTEWNTCVDPCCPGMELVPGVSAGVCECFCSDPNKIVKPCQTADCVGKVVCTDPEPDSGELGWFGSSKYRWDENACEWVCKNSCPNGQEQDPDTCECKQYYCVA
jgi:hypothetical protein